MDTALPPGMKGEAKKKGPSRTERHRCAKVELRHNHLRNGGPEMNAKTYGLDVAKRVFQMYWVDAQTGEIVNRRFRRDELIRFLAQRPAGRVALEACGSGHWWARKIKAVGHEVVLLHAKFIRPSSCRRTRPMRRMRGRSGRRCSSRKCGPWQLRPRISRRCSVCIGCAPY